MKKINKLEKIGGEYFDSYISGIPCQIKVETFTNVQPWKGSPHNCPSDGDFYGYTEFEFSVFDRKGYAANWLEKKLTSDDEDRIESEYIENENRGY